MPKHVRVWTIRIIAVLALACTPSFSVGIRVPQKDAGATARGNAFVATADTPAAVHYNPAGLTQVEGQQVRAGVFGFAPYMDYSSSAGDVERKRIAVADPQLYWTSTSRELPFSVGLGLYTSYGFKLEWPDDAPFRTVGLRGELIYGTLQPVAAWKLTENFSIGGGPTLNYATIDFRRGVAVPGDEFRFDGEGSDLGYTIGLLWKPHRMHSFGAIYRSATTINFEGDTRLDVPFAPPFPPRQSANARFDFPQNVTVGYSFRPTPAWNFEVNVDWTDWDRVDTFIIEQTPNLPMELNWRSSFIYELGITRALGKGWHASTGYMYVENSIPEESFNPVIPDMDLHAFSAGVSRTSGQLTWQLGYQFVYAPDRHISNPTTAPNASANGTYQFIGHAFTAAVGWRF
jgi:long-chain fatty acid transport protein